MNFTAIDFETANWYRSSACAIGLVRVENGEIIKKYKSLIRPTPNFYNSINTKIHGLNADDTANAPRFKEIWREIKKWVEGEIVVAHNISFDRSVLKHVLEKYKLKADIKKSLCSLYLSRVHIQGLENYKLTTVYRHLFNEDFKHHDALEDALACAKIVQHITNEWKPPSFEGMIDGLYQKKTTLSTKVKLGLLTMDEGYIGRTEMKGKTFVFTGKLPDFTREEAAQFVVNRGGLAGDNVTKSTTDLVIGGYATRYGANFKSSKLKKALDLKNKGQSINIWSDADFLELVRKLEG